MQKRVLYVAAFLVLAAILTGFSNNAEQHTTAGDNSELSAANAEDADIQKGTSGVIAKVKELQNLTEEDADNMEDINEIGEAIEKNWDSIEKKVKKSYPDDYQNIEKSLYPLIAAAQKDEADKANLRTLSLETLDKLETFKQKL